MDRNPSFRPPLASGLFGLASAPCEHPVESRGLVMDIVNRSSRPVSYRCYSGTGPDQHPLFTGEVAPHGTVRIERLAGESSPKHHSLLIEAQPTYHTGARTALQASIFLLAVMVFTAGVHAQSIGPKLVDRPTITGPMDTGGSRPAPRIEQRRAVVPAAMRCPRVALRAKTPICGGIALA